MQFKGLVGTSGTSHRLWWGLVSLLGLLAGAGGQAAEPATGAGGSGAPAAASAPLPPEVFFGWPDMSRPKLSPSGRWLAVLVAGADDFNRLAVIDLQSPGKVTLAARFSDVDIDEVYWVDDDWLVFDVIDRRVAGGENRFWPGLYSVRRDGSGQRQLVDVQGRFVDEPPLGGVERRLPYNHVLLHVPRPADGAEPEVIIGEYRWDSRDQFQAILPKRVNVATGRNRSIAQGMPEFGSDWWFDAAGQPRLVQSRRDGRVKTHWRAPGQDNWTVLDDSPALSRPWLPHSVDNAGGLYVTQSLGKAGTSALKRFDFAASKPETEPLVNAPGFDFNGRLVSEYPGGRTLGIRVLTDGETTVWLEPRLKALQAEVDKQLPGLINRLTCRRCEGDDRVVLVESWSDREPGRWSLWRDATGQLQPVGRSQRAVQPQQMATLDFHRFAARDQRQIPVWVTLPRGPAPAGGRPAVLLVHGGPWVRGGRWAWDAMPQFLASRGYAVIEPEFRGSTGYGQDHFRAGWRQWGQAMQDDLADAVAWAAAAKLIDPKRVCIAGASYGGYAALMGLVRQPELFRCGAAWAAVTEPMRLLTQSWWTRNTDISDEARNHDMKVLLGDPEADAAMLKAHSPLQQAAAIKTPLLLAHGGLDRRVPLAHATDLRAAMQKAGQEPEWVLYPGEAHGWSRLDNRVDFARRLEAFLGRHLK